MKQSISITAHDLCRLRRLAGDLARGNHAMQESASALEELLDTGHIVEPERIPGDVITMHSQVRFEDPGCGELSEITIVYHPGDADPASGKISILSPVGIALLGLPAGSETVLPLPHGRSTRIRIREVLWQPEAQGLFAL